MKLGARGQALIKSFEALRLAAYLDIRGIPTIGWGHTGWYAPDVPVRIGQTCSESQAEIWFEDDTAQAVLGVNRLLDIALNQNQFDALVSFAYNVGVGALAHSTLLERLNAGNPSAAAQQFLRWDYAGHVQSDGLERRRRAERDLFLLPV